MGIYKANSYNPITSIQAGLREATERGKLAGDKYRADADFWKGATEIGQKFADDMGKVGLNAYDMYVEQNDTPEARLAALEQELAEAQHIKDVQDKYNSQVNQRKNFDRWAEMGDRQFTRPAEVGRYNPMQGLSNYGLEEIYRQEMQGYHPGPNLSDYSTYINAINSAPGVYPEIEDEYRRGI